MHEVKWAAPLPLWPEILGNGDTAPKAQFGSPAIFRFDSDSFMDEFMAVLERDPAQLGDFVASPETWREPMPAPKALSLLEPAERESRLARKLKRLRVSEGRMGAGQGSTAPRAAAASAPPGPLKLYQPAHQRYYLVAASLVCGAQGFTDHKIDTGHQERVTFVVRRLLPSAAIDNTIDLPAPDPAGWDEYALVAGAGGPGWRKVERRAGENCRTLLAGEEQLPLFPVYYPEDDGRRRRLLAGLVPVGKREAYMGAAGIDPAEPGKTAAGALSKAARMVLFRTQVAEPWKNLVEQAFRICKVLNESKQSGDYPEQPEIDALLKGSHQQLQTMSWYILLDFANYLERYLSKAWDVIQGKTDVEEPQPELLLALDNARVPEKIISELTRATIDKSGGQVASIYDSSRFATSLRDALSRIGEYKDFLEEASLSYDRTNPGKWPDFLFPFAGVTNNREIALPKIADGRSEFTLSGRPLDDEKLKEEAQNSIDKLLAMLERELPTEPDQPAPPPPLAAQPLLDSREGWFVIRSVYERPNCGPLHPAVVSGPTAPFQLAGFFDPDAPARPIRIALPIDTSLAGLRKFDKNTAFMISDMLCGQIKRAKGMTLGDLVLSVLPWPFHKDLPVPETGPCKTDKGAQLGMICSLSIPIITICALILLMIIVTVLDYIFRWLPYFIVCFPLPGFRAKKGGGTP